MATYTISGKVHQIYPSHLDSSKDNNRSFRRREIILDCSSYNGEKIVDNFPIFTFSGDKCDLLDDFRHGQEVIITFNLFGVRWFDSKNGTEKFSNRISAYKIEKVRE